MEIRLLVIDAQSLEIVSCDWFRPLRIIPDSPPASDRYPITRTDSLPTVTAICLLVLAH